MSLSFWVRDYIFLQLARVRREIWWPDLALVLTMVLFGLWHGATYLFLLWGLYHGVLLIFQPHLQRLQGRSRWSSSTIFWTPLSWFATATLISLGWILFRANSLPRAVQMFAAIASPASYSTHLLSGSLYLLVLGAATGYAAVLVAVEWINKELDRQSEQTAGEPSHSRSGLVAIAARNRWYWIPPLYGLALLILLIVTHTQSAVASQFMYRRF
jgi:hypothetical protein